MRAMLNNAIKGDYNAETDPSVSSGQQNRDIYFVLAPSDSCSW